MNTLLLALLHSLWQGVAPAAVAQLLFLRSSRPEVRSRIGELTMAAQLVAFLGTSEQRGRAAAERAADAEQRGRAAAEAAARTQAQARTLAEDFGAAAQADVVVFTDGDALTSCEVTKTDDDTVEVRCTRD